MRLMLIFTLAFAGIASALAEDEATNLEQKGIAALKLAQTQSDDILSAAHFFADADAACEAARENDRAVEMKGYLYWCRKGMSDEQFLRLSKEDSAAAKRVQAAENLPVAVGDGVKYAERASAFSLAHPDEHLLIAIKFFEVAGRFRGTALSLEAQDRSLKELTLSRQAADKTATIPAADPKPANPAKKLAVPAAADQKAAEAVVNDIYKEEMGNTTPQEQHALAEKMLKQAEITQDDDAGRYVLLSAASHFAALAGDLDLFLKIRDDLSARYLIDSADFTKKGLASLVASPKDVALAKVLAAFKALQTKPDNNLLVGKHFTFGKENFEQGAAYLAKSAHPALKALASQELKPPETGPLQLLLGDAWWNFSENGAEKDEKLPAQRRAVFWYRKALPSLTGLSKMKIEKRIADVAPPLEQKTEAQDAPKNPANPSNPAASSQPKETAKGPFPSKPGVVESFIDLGENVKLELVQVKPGRFLWGSADSDAGPEEKPVQTVTISRAFLLGKYPVTVNQFKRFVDAVKYTLLTPKSKAPRNR